MKIKKWIAVDLDGTLLAKGSETLSLESEKYLVSLGEKGYAVILLSGRPYRAMIDLYQRVNTKAPMVSYNGQEITCPNDPSFKKLMKSYPLSSVKEFLRRIKGHVDFVQAETIDHVYLTEHDAFIEHYFPLQGMKVTEGPVEENLDSNPFSVIVRREESEKAFLEEAVKGLSGIALRHWTACPYSELYISDAHKGSALAYIMSIYDIPKEDVIAFGDSRNDLEMLLEAGTSFAMKDAKSKHLQERFPLTEYPSTEDGVIKELQKILK